MYQQSEPEGQNYQYLNVCFKVVEIVSVLAYLAFMRSLASFLKSGHLTGSPQNIKI